MCIHILPLHKLHFYHKSKHFILLHLDIYLYIYAYIVANENLQLTEIPYVHF